MKNDVYKTTLSSMVGANIMLLWLLAKKQAFDFSVVRRVSQICLVSVNRPTDLKTRKTRDSESGVKIPIKLFE